MIADMELVAKGMDILVRELGIIEAEAFSGINADKIIVPLPWNIMSPWNWTSSSEKKVNMVE